MGPFRIVLFSAMAAQPIDIFLRRIAIDLPEVTVAGVLYETPRPPLRPQTRLKLAARNLRNPDYLRFVAHKVGSRIGRCEWVTDPLLRAVHGVCGGLNRSPTSLEELQRQCDRAGIAFHVTDDMHAWSSLQFVREISADLGIIYGTRILKPELFSIPRLGSINIHKHKVPRYRGSGAPGLWELRDGETEQGVTVHRVIKDVDAGAVLGERTFRIEPYDTLGSVGLKADLVGIDCLTDVIDGLRRGTVAETPQSSDGHVYKGYQAYQIWAIEEAIRKKRRAFRPRNGRPVYKLLARTAAYPALYARNRRYARQKRFPVIILFHHLVTDRPKFMGIPTEQFLKQIQFLKKHYRIVSLPEAMEMLERGPVAQPTVVLTFDDGYEDNFLCLRAVIEAEAVPVTLFVCTEHITRGTPFEHDLRRQESGFPPMSWDQLRHLDRHGVTIGSHTRSHFDCGSTDTRMLRHEIEGALEDLRRELGHDVPYFSFPWGHPRNMSDEAVRIAQKSYAHVFSACGGANWAQLPRGSTIKRCPHPQSVWELELTLQLILEAA